MRQHLAWPHLRLPRKWAASARRGPRAGPHDKPTPSAAERRQVLKDKLAVAAVLLLVLATVTVFVFYLVHQAPHFRAGELTALATPSPAMAAQTTIAAGNQGVRDTVAGTGIGRIPLILISTVVEMGIFVALGLYLRHDMNRKP